MNIFLGIFSSVVVSTSFACQIIIKQKYNVIFIVIFSLLLFKPCLTSNELGFDNHETDSNPSSNNDEQQQWFGPNINHVSVESTVTTPIHKSIALSSFILMLSERYPRRTTWYDEQKIPTTKAYVDTLNTDAPTPDIDVLTTTTFAPFPIRAQKATSARRKNGPTNNRNKTVLILIQTMENIQLHRIREQFREFSNTFGVQLHNITVDFDVIDGLSTLVKRLDALNYSTVFYMFDGNNIRESGSNCDMAHQLSTAYRKQIILWPCPQMKSSERHLPSFQTISYAIKSISQKFNWTEAVIFAGGHEWGLPLAIAANLHLPYRIKVGLEDFNEFPSIDVFDRLFIITSPLNSPETLTLLNRLNVFNRSKILVIDIIGTIFNKQNEFYNVINRNKDKWLTSNLLVLTTLTSKLKRYLNATLTNEYNSIYNRMDNETFMDTNPMAIDENVVITLLKQRLSTINGTTRAGERNEWIEGNILGFFNDIELKLVDSLVFGKILNNSRNCNLRVENVSKARASHKNSNKSIDNNNVTTIDFEQNSSNFQHRNASTACATHMEQIAKCAVYLGERTKDVLDTNETRTFHNYLIKVMCKQLYQRQQHLNTSLNHKSKNIPPTSTANIVAQRNDTAFVANIDNNENLKRTNEFINLISAQIDNGQFSEYFPFFDFVLSKIVKIYNFTVNYTMPGNSQGVTINTSNITTASMDNQLAAATGATDDNENDTFDFCVLDFRPIQVAINDTNETNDTSIQTKFPWRPILILRQNELHQNIFVTHPLQSIGYRWFFDNTQKFWTCGLLCWILAGIVILLLVCIFVGSITFGLAIRNYLLKKRLSKGPNKIVLSAADFVFPIDARRVDEGIEAMLCCWLQQLQEFGGPEVEKPDLLKGSIGSVKNLGLAGTAMTTTTTIVSGPPASASTIAATATANTSTTTTTSIAPITTSQAKTANASTTGSIIKHNPCCDKRARYNGDLVQLKEMPSGASNELKSKAMDFLIMAHGLRHENINPLIGWLADPTRTAMVFEYCSRGSLQDVLIMDEIKLDWSFRLSLLTDLVRGMRYLHSSPMRVHGALTSRNCIVDARWVLKVTDYGLNQFYEAQGVQMPPLTAKEMLWTSPELLRNSKGNNKFGTQMGDVYSFGIIMQEVVVRGEPYCMLSLSAEEIVLKLKKPPPLIRPSVSKGAAPPEAINIMRQCWAETPDMRPDFNSVYERFKVLNHGRKVNFVDTMFQLLEKYSNNLEELIRERTDQLDIERKKTEQLLNRMLPSSVAEKLKLGLNVEPEEYSDVTIYFSDIVGFTTIAAYCSPVQVVDLLNDLYTCFDATINAYSVYKVETIGDAYMVVSGLPVRIPDHAGQIATMALDLLHQSGRFKIKHLPEVPLQLRIGLHTGPCCAGVVGLTMPRYCLFGDTVNTASRMESTGTSWRIHLSEATRDRLEKAGGYHLEPRGGIEIKGKGIMNTYWLLGKKGFDKPLPQPPTVGESHGLDETLIQHCIRSKQRTKTPCISATHSSSQSSSLAGEPVDVKVEITPPRDIDSIQMPNSCSIELNCLNEYKIPSPQQRKMSELPTDSLLSAANYGRLTPSPSSTSSCKIYKKFEEFLDLSTPYNHYRCLSPSESNLTQCHDGKYIYGVGKLDNKPGSSRLLRRQFSLDKDDCNNISQTAAIAQLKSSLDVPYVQDIPLRSTSSPTNIKPGRLQKQNSASVALDLEKIEEIPISPKLCGFNHRNSYLSRIPGSAAGSPASKKPIDSMENVTTIATLEVPGDISPRAISPISATTIYSNSTNGGDSDGANGNICYHI